MKLLCLDTSSGVLSLAVAEGEKILFSQNRKLGRKMSAALIPSIENILKKASQRTSDIDVFCVGVGPGSFTGLRVGIAAIKALAYGVNKPVVASSSLELIAMNVRVSETKPIIVIQDARRDMVYFAIYERNAEGLKIIQTPKLVLWKDFCAVIKTPCVIIGDGVPLLSKEFRDKLAEEQCVFYDKDKQWIAQAKYLPILVKEKINKKQFDNIFHLTPMYLHPEDCQVRR